MHEIEEEAAFEQGVIHAVHVLPHESPARGPVEQVGALAHHHAHIRDEALIDEVGVVPGHPLKIFPHALHPRTSSTFGTELFLTKCASCLSIHSKYLRAGSSQRRSSPMPFSPPIMWRSEEHTSELQSRQYL